MLIQISAGQGKGIKECEYFCYRFFQELLKEFSTLEVVSAHYRDKVFFKSVILYTKEDLSFLEGTIQWICKSPFRSHHKRKNWFIDVSVIKEDLKIDDLGEIRYEVFRSSKKGGQNVNKVSTAIRAIHVPTSIVAISMDQRSQAQNKKIAYLRLLEKIDEANLSVNKSIHYLNWKKHNSLIRGNPIRKYEGDKFIRIK